MSMKSRFCSIQVLLFLTMFSCPVFSSLKTMKWFSFATMLICQKSFVLVWWEGKTRLWQQQWRNNRWFWMISRWWTWPIPHFLHQGNEVLQCTLQCIQWQLTQVQWKSNVSFCDGKDRKTKTLKQRESFHHKSVFENNQTNNFHISVCHLNELVKLSWKEKVTKTELVTCFQAELQLYRMLWKSQNGKTKMNRVFLSGWLTWTSWWFSIPAFLDEFCHLLMAPT